MIEECSIRFQLIDNFKETHKCTDTQNNSLESEVIKYRCPCCRVILFNSYDVIPHKAEKVRDFVRKRRQAGNIDSPCNSLFIEKPNWLDARGRTSDNINCPKCGYKIGRFSWIGSQCTCGEWVKPSFQILMSRVDSI